MVVQGEGKTKSCRQIQNSTNSRRDIKYKVQELPGIVWQAVQRKAFAQNQSLTAILVGVIAGVVSRWQGVESISYHYFWGAEKRNLQYKESKGVWHWRRNASWQDQLADLQKQLTGQADETEENPVLLIWHEADKAGNEMVLADGQVLVSIHQPTGKIELHWQAQVDGWDDAIMVGMTQACEELLLAYAEADDKDHWPDCLPATMRERRQKVNETNWELIPNLIHQEFFRRSGECPEQVALLWEEEGQERFLSYGELARQALQGAAYLKEQGMKPGEPVAISLARGPGQVAAVLAVLAAGGVYVPVGLHQPAARQAKIVQTCRLRYWLTDLAGKESLPDFDNVQKIAWEEIKETKFQTPTRITSIDSDSLAYIIFTSGSTGEPKGVAISHRAAHNTLQDVNDRFGVKPQDRILAVSALDFDLSVYDIFGLLSAGGSVVLLQEAERREARRWRQLVNRWQVTIWNTVPALLDMLLTAGEEEQLPSLRVVLLSGDWIGLDLPPRLRRQSPSARFAALGGATEASIWSNCFEVEKVQTTWKSIPYGQPLRNQSFRVVDSLGRDCPDYIAGELWIGGAGVARGYYGNPELTAERFVEAAGEIWYRTGDQGRYWDSGILEFLGRMDTQIKLSGFRVELGEVEAALKSCPGVGQAVAAVFSTRQNSRHLVAAVVPANSQTIGITEKEAVLPYTYPCAEEEAVIVEKALARILNLQQLRQAGAKNVFEGNRKEVLRLWLQWLQQRQVIAGYPQIVPGVRFAQVIEMLADGAAQLATAHTPTGKVQRQLFKRIPEYRAFLQGENQGEFLLSDEVLAPEILASQVPEVKEGFQRLAEHVRRRLENTGDALRIAFLGTRSGQLVKQWLEYMPSERVALTCLDSSPLLLAEAQKKLSAMPHAIRYALLPTGYIPEEYRYAFDVVVAVQSLHAYPQALSATLTVQNLLAAGGELLALEGTRMGALGLLTAAILENGFVRMDVKRQVSGQPLFSAAQWQEALQQADLENKQMEEIGESGLLFWVAKCAVSRREFRLEDLLKAAERQVPFYMVPEKVCVIPAVPLSGNGKVDRGAIGELFREELDQIDYQAPQTAAEKEMAALWQQLLGGKEVGRQQSFFEVGGDSLLATRLLAELKKRYQVDLTLRQIFETPTLEAVTALVEASYAQTVPEMAMEEGEI